MTTGFYVLCSWILLLCVGFIGGYGMGYKRGGDDTFKRLIIQLETVFKSIKEEVGSGEK